MYAFATRSGTELWASGPATRGAFYSTPAVAYGRVYIGSTDGSVYAFGAGRGKLLWFRPTGGYVYASPAVWRRRILIGSYDASFYALDAATGDELWRFRANGPISGSATVLDGVVYFSTLRERTYALDARTGKELWTWPDGKYSPVVAEDVARSPAVEVALECDLRPVGGPRCIGIGAGELGDGPLLGARRRHHEDVLAPESPAGERDPPAVRRPIGRVVAQFMIQAARLGGGHRGGAERCDEHQQDQTCARHGSLLPVDVPSFGLLANGRCDAPPTRR